MAFSNCYCNCGKVSITAKHFVFWGIRPLDDQPEGILITDSDDYLRERLAEWESEPDWRGFASFGVIEPGMSITTPIVETPLTERTFVTVDHKPLRDFAIRWVAAFDLGLVDGTELDGGQ